jgi:hypothetical protein
VTGYAPPAHSRITVRRQPAPATPGDRLPQQRSLSDARLAAHDERGAAARVRGRERSVEALELGVATDQVRP